MEIKRHAVLLALIEQLQQQGSWTGKTHVLKTLFLIQTAGRMEVPEEYVLYKHGPYSFVVEGEIEEMKSYAGIRRDEVASGYGFSFRPGKNAAFIREKASLSAAEQAEIRRVCAFVNTKSVADLERVATAAWIFKREGLSDPNAVGKRLNELKPHISAESGTQAFVEVQPVVDAVR